MTNKTIVSIAMAALVLGALPAAASHSSHEKRDDRTAQLARELQQATTRLYSRVAVRGHYRSAAQWRAALVLRSLHHEARDFRSGVDRYGADHPRTRVEFRELTRALGRAQHASELRHSRQLRGDFERVARLVNTLDSRLAARAEYRPDDRDRRGRDDYRGDHHRRDRYDRVALFSLSFGSR